MTVEQREMEEGRGAFRTRLLGKVRSYMRKNFSGESAQLDPETVKRVLLQVAIDWCANRGVRMSIGDIREVVEEGYNSHCQDWQGKEEGEDCGGRRLGDAGKGGRSLGDEGIA